MNLKEKTKFKNNKKVIIKKAKNEVKGITLIALVVTIALNCCCSGRKLKYIALNK